MFEKPVFIGACKSCSHEKVCKYVEEKIKLKDFIDDNDLQMFLNINIGCNYFKCKILEDC